MKVWVLTAVINLLACTAGLGMERQDLESFLATLPAVEGKALKFREYRHSSLFEQALVLEGELGIDAQGALVKQLHSPIQEKMIIGTREFSLETPGKSYKTGLSRSPFLKALSAGMRGLLKRDADGILSVFEATLEQDGGDWVMLLRPRDQALRKYVDRLEIAGCPGQVSVVNIHTGQDEWHEMIFPEALEACAQ